MEGGMRVEKDGSREETNEEVEDIERNGKKRVGRGEGREKIK